MGKTVWKYPLNRGITILEVPVMSRPVFVGMQDDFPFVWVQVYDTEEETEELKLETIATGQRLYNTWSKHIGSFLVDGGEFVWHVYEVLNDHKD